jgi:UDP:flavonoid glycosyltransferase YjiC (YdhE family)
MSRFGILSFPGTGHSHPLTALGRELAKRGHTVTIFPVADLEHRAEFPVQTVISLPVDPIVVRYAPQLALLSRAALTIFHGGLNTALESLAQPHPLIR